MLGVVMAMWHCGVWVWWYHGPLSQLEKIITEHAQWVETIDQSEGQKIPHANNFL